MAKILFVVLVLAVGCGGPSFTVGAVDEVDGSPPAAGGAPVVGPGGKVGLSTGGNPAGGAGAGGVPSSGGSLGSTGGAVDVDGGHGSGGAPSSGGAQGDSGATDAACTLVTHNNSAGQTWQDCAPLGTYNEAEATKACGAWADAHSGTCAIGTCASIYKSAYVQTSHALQAQFLYWTWEGPNAGEIQESTTLGGTCVTVTPWS